MIRCDILSVSMKIEVTLFFVCVSVFYNIKSKTYIAAWNRGNNTDDKITSTHLEI